MKQSVASEHIRLDSCRPSVQEIPRCAIEREAVGCRCPTKSIQKQKHVIRLLLRDPLPPSVSV